MCAATVPMEFNFGTSGNLKSARRLRNLDLKKQRPTVHPLFGNTGSVVGKAYAASGGVKPGATGKQTGPGIARPASALSPVGRLPGIKPMLAHEQQLQLQQGDDNQGGQIIPSQAAQNPVIPSSLDQPKVQQGGGGGFFSNGKNVLLAGGGALGLLFILYIVFFNKKTRHSRRRKSSNGNKKSRKR